MRSAVACALFLGLTFAGPARAHDLQPGAIAFRELSPGLFSMRLTNARDGSATPARVIPRLPGDCRLVPEGLRCPSGLAGTLEVPALARRRVKVIVHVRYLDGRTFEGMLREGESRIEVGPEVDAEGADAPALGSYFGLGWEHILGGFDHLLFVLGLALVARRPRRVAIAVTGFTVAHSITLALTVLGVVAAPGPAIELIIAASILLLSVEATRDEDTLTARFPWVVAFGFGLVHGFGFAGALAELGLPEDAVLPAIALFNVGVEAGQLVVLAAGLALAWLAARRMPAKQVPRLRLAAGYAIGLPAGVWTIERLVAWTAALQS